MTCQKGWKEKFLDKMFIEKDIEAGLKLYISMQPQTIFRYRQGNHNDITALKNEEIWLSNMKCVNDKFEGQLEIVYDSMKLNYKFLEDILKKQVDEVMESIISSFYIACFCESVLKNTMWSHYANNHKGYCIEYYIDSFDDPQFVFPVIYKESKKVDIGNIEESDMYKSILTKYSDWSSEDEWRIILPYPDKKSNGKMIKQPLPKAIYMGVDIDSELSEILSEYCQNRGVDLYRMELEKDKNQLRPKQMML